MKFFVTGVNGQLGFDVAKELFRRGYEVIGSDMTSSYQGVPDDILSVLSYQQLDITDGSAVRTVLKRVNPDGVIHCAAYTAVDAAEDPANEATVYAVNEGGTRHLAEVCRDLDCKMTYISTDYVFNGEGTAPYPADCREFAPQNVYGRSKLRGEQAVTALLEKYFIVRIAWVFGLNGKNFVKTMINVGKTHASVKVVNDQIGTPTYTADLAVLLADLNETEQYGCYHATNEGGFISWYDFCVEIYRRYGLTTEVLPVSTAEYGLAKAKRPFNSRLDKSKLQKAGFRPLPSWQDALARYLKEARL